ncbi:MAG: hypothetical protein GWN14_01590 [candidate division Zixibacteria bacterium]|nr:hypothetical protein [Gammaproteobacteria bacterium]NIX54652.1 hypothetical protein [candidate division Zixibacteria bacterium]
MKIIGFIRRKKFWFLVGASILLIAFSPIPRISSEPKTVTIPVKAESYAFSPGVIKVNQGDRVVIELTSMDVVHGLYLDTYGLSITSDPGQTTQLSFVADQPGTFRFRCSVTCGALHPFMMGKLKVGTNDLVWRGSALAIVMGVFGLWRMRNE